MSLAKKFNIYLNLFTYKKSPYDVLTVSSFR